MMSIVAYTGLPGSGKSYGVVENVIINALKDGRTIVTNIALKTGTLLDDYPTGKIHIFDQVDPSFWILDNYPGAVWIIDEAHHFWPSGLKMNNVPDHIKAFFTEHRHCVGQDGKTTEIVIVTQDLGQVASFLRNLVEDTYRAVKLSALGMSKKYRIDVYQGGVTGSKPKGHYRQLFGKYKPEIYRYYRSHTKNRTDFAAGMEEKTDERANALKNPLVKYGLPSAIILILYSGYKALTYFNKSPEKPLIDQDKLPVNNPVPITQTASIQKAAIQREIFYAELDLDKNKIELSEEWRITGQINGAFIIDSQTRGSRLIPVSRCRHYVQTNEQYCVISGKLVTWYSATIPETVEEVDRNYGESIKEDILN